jgi:hypothetical protein
VLSHLSVSTGKKGQKKHSHSLQGLFSYPKKTLRKKTKYFLKFSPEESGESRDECEKEYRVTYARIYTDKTRRVKKNALTTKKFERILINVSNKRPNTLIILFFLLYQGFHMVWDGCIKGIQSLSTDSIKTLRSSRALRLWHWVAIDGPRKFWKFPRSIQIGRSISTIIQVIFYPKK